MEEIGNRDNTLYERLGILRTASQEEIKKAYYKTAFTTHPDGGGDNEEFHSTIEAYKTLSDPIKRRRYDLTGMWESPQSEPLEDHVITTQAYGYITSELQRQVDSHGSNVFHVDIIEEIKLSFHRETVRVKNSIEKINKDVKLATQLLDKFEFDGEGFDIISHVFETSIKSMRETQIDLGKEKKAYLRAMEILKGYKFNKELSFFFQKIFSSETSSTSDHSW